MKVVHKHTIFLDRVQSNIYINAMQADAYTRILEFSLYSGGVEWNVPGGVSVAVAYGGASGHGVYDTLPDGLPACTVSGNVVTAVVVPQAIAMHGNTNLTIVFTDDSGKQLTAFCVTLKVEKNPAIDATKPPDYINMRQWLTAELSNMLLDYNLIVFPAGDGYITEEAMSDIQAAFKAGRTMRCELETDEQELIYLPLVKVQNYIYYFAAVCDGMEWLVTIAADDEGNTVTTVTRREVGSGSSGGGSGETTIHGIVWDLVNVTSSNPIASVNDSASLSAVLTPADGYTLGDVIVTMGGEALTGVWNADTATVTIPSVTGDVMISCAGVAIVSVDTTPVIEVSGKGINNAGRVYANENWGYTKYYPINDTNITIYGTNTEGVGSPTSNAIMTVFLNSDAATTSFVDILTGYANPLSTMNCGKEYSTDIPDTTTGLRATILLAEIDNYYCYETNTKKVIFAGKNTPYYGMTTINGATGGSTASASELSFDDDIAQNYAVATASILGEDTAADPNAAYGVSADLAAVIDEVRTAWMMEYGGDYRKIPLIITADQHARTNSGIFNMLGKTLSFHDVSKVMNLGDTVSVEWFDKDTSKPLLSCDQLEKWCESIKAIPFSKRLDVYGNHDTWYGNHDDEGNTIGTRYPANQSHLDQYFRNIYARRNNNNGWFAIRDDYFNVKYVVISGFEYDGSVTFRIGTKQMQFIIDEFSKDDGYDIVVVSHVPLYHQVSTNIYPTGMEPEDVTDTTVARVAAIDTDALFTARKNKTTGTVTDSDGVEHSFDFSDCTTDILCGLHGHTHDDAYNYTGGSGLLSEAFDWFDENTVHFVLVDRVNRLVNVWKLEGDALTYTNYQVPLDKPAE